MMQQQPPAKGEMLKRYTVDLTALASDGKLDPVIGTSPRGLGQRLDKV